MPNANTTFAAFSNTRNMWLDGAEFEWVQVRGANCEFPTVEQAFSAAVAAKMKDESIVVIDSNGNVPASDEPAAETPVSGDCIPRKAFAISASGMKMAASLFIKAVDDALAISINSGEVVLIVEKAIGHVEGAMPLNKSFFVSSNAATLMAVLASADIFVVNNRGVPEYLLRKTKEPPACT